uniref:Uncharacterized protein n=1 Tax=Odontella aurita TaxID=265563 RepID=A0A6U6GKN3_9STRA|mmetsp:Transcript_42473/g.128875  ORF Transcript_42473/g.128875 Transcript_42473/m.128875 type:complete len:147 (+) Transcript_42473:573-1013(+)|eukprot:CAMPEP_0113567344 /NCGR_PEP_ID=MMETSP0015_2-20120614/23225_1 /TAXON_ID=2838 /ORGANISM="Odontella" /LENGTH=146 /DNA_ID=CAMNT_0000469731 /DNA_START=478 /DNA_END=918 /DNA_ORIENTATION=+ /assembly_acc=CAM_ASM_000160
MHGTSEHQLNPIANWAFTVTRVMSIDGWNKSWTVGTAIKKGRVGQITGAEIAKIFKTAVDDIGKDVLGFSTKDVGTHLNQLAAAMAMHLANVPVCTIILAGRWSFDAFLFYIRKQVQEFTQGVHQKIVLTEDYCTILDEMVRTEDP